MLDLSVLSRMICVMLDEFGFGIPTEHFSRRASAASSRISTTLVYLCLLIYTTLLAVGACGPLSSARREVVALVLLLLRRIDPVTYVTLMFQSILP